MPEGESRGKEGPGNRDVGPLDQLRGPRKTDFPEGPPVNPVLPESLHVGGFMRSQENLVLKFGRCAEIGLPGDAGPEQMFVQGSEFTHREAMPLRQLTMVAGMVDEGDRHYRLSVEGGVSGSAR